MATDQGVQWVTPPEPSPPSPPSRLGEFVGDAIQGFGPAVLAIAVLWWLLK